MRAGNVLSFLGNDHLGSTAFIMDSGGALMTHLRYYAYGMTWSQSNPSAATDLRFTGHRQMGAKSGTYYAGARDYSADLGRFAQPETSPQIKGKAPCAVSRRNGVLTNGERVQRSDPRLLNGYSYVIINPSSYVYPDGRFMSAFDF